MRRERGFTLFEAIITIALIGILAAIASVFMVRPIEGYFATSRRAEVTDIADGAVRRMGRDVRRALPNSMRTATFGASQYLELLMTRTGGRYRMDLDDGTIAGEDILDFATPDNQFDTLERLSTLADQVMLAGDLVVVHNLGIAGASAYAGDNSSAVTAFSAGGGAAPNEDRIQIVAKRFALESPARRFQVVSGPVSYECLAGAVDANGDGTGVLRRYSGYAFGAAQPTPPVGGITAELARYVTACDIQYTPLALQARAMVSIRLGLTRGGESISLYYEAHVSNVP